MELDHLLIELYKEYSLFHSGSIAQFVKNKEFKTNVHLRITIRSLLYDLGRGGSITKSLQYYNAMLSEQGKEAIILALKSGVDSND